MVFFFGVFGVVLWFGMIGCGVFFWSGQLFLLWSGVNWCVVVCSGVMYCVFLSSVIWVFWHDVVCVGVLCSLVVWGFLVWCSMTWYVFWYGKSWCGVACVLVWSVLVWCSGLMCLQDWFNFFVWCVMVCCCVVCPGVV